MGGFPGLVKRPAAAGSLACQGLGARAHIARPAGCLCSLRSPRGLLLAKGWVPGRTLRARPVVCARFARLGVSCLPRVGCPGARCAPGRLSVLASLASGSLVCQGLGARAHNAHPAGCLCSLRSRRGILLTLDGLGCPATYY